MFVQVIEGRVADREGLQRQMDRWMVELRPGAEGFLGAAAGITDDGRAVNFALFESADAARANSERAEQGNWWAETEKCFSSPVSFADTDQVETFLDGGSVAAGFVQIMKGRGDRDRLREMDARMSQHAAAFRPDLIGGFRAWVAPDRYVEAVYFTSEEEARANEANEPPPEMIEDMGEFQSMMAEVEFIDLADPWLY